MESSKKFINPIQDLFHDINKIIEFIEVKDQREADLYETIETRDDAEMWIGAMIQKDTYLTYRKFWDTRMFQEVVPNVRYDDIIIYLEKPYTVPAKYWDNLLVKGRNTFLDQYVEKNNYYRMISGLPPIGTPKNEFIYVSTFSESLQAQLHVDPDTPIHELSTLVQNRLIGSDEFLKVLNENPDKLYLKYFGIYKIDIFVARRARDFELIRYLPMSRSDINPNLLKEFGRMYNEYREYVFRVLYNEQLEELYENYRTFMKLLIQQFTLMQICNKSVEGITEQKFLDDNILYIILSMYGIPRSLLMTKEVRRNLVINLLKLTREKGTDNVYYDLIKVLGYQDIIISKFMIMKGQEFNNDTGQTSFADGSLLNSFDDINRTLSVGDDQNPLSRLDVDPYFLKIDLLDPHPYDTISEGKAPVYTYRAITEPDPTWWDRYCPCGCETKKCRCGPGCPNCDCYERELTDVEELLLNSHYTVADSKYIMVEAIISQSEYLFESIFFTRMILDNKKYTDTFEIILPEIFGTEPVSIYDIMLFIVTASCMNLGLTGEIITGEKNVLATAGFNFDIDLVYLDQLLDTMRYVDKDKIRTFIENLSIKDISSIERLFNDVMYPMKEWLKFKMSESTKKEEFLEYEALYKAFYTYDINRNSIIADFKSPLETIQEKYELTNEDIIAYQHYYPRTKSGDAVHHNQITSLEYRDYFYPPFQGTWEFETVAKGTLYFHDILNSPDVRYLKNQYDEFIFWDEEHDEETGTNKLLPDRDTIHEVVSFINSLSEEELKGATFKVDTYILDSGGKGYVAGDSLPANIQMGLFKQILLDKITMDLEGFSVPPKTYSEYLYRKNPRLYSLLTENNRIEYDREGWMNDVMNIVLILETELSMHMKYFEQSIVGLDLFFRPLITLIKHFKSTYVSLVKTGVQYIFGDKVDSGGNSNMFKIFDYMATTIHFLMLSKRGHSAQFGLYDTEHKATHGIIIKDRSQFIRLGNSGFDVKNRRNWMGSMRMVDEMKFFKNGEPIDPSDHTSSFYVGEVGTGRWSQDDDIIMRNRTDPERIQNIPVDVEGWKLFVES